MKRASYRHAVELIALNDEPRDLDPETIEGYVTVQLISDLFGVPAARLAADVARLRAAESKAERES